MSILMLFPVFMWHTGKRWKELQWKWLPWLLKFFHKTIALKSRAGYLHGRQRNCAQADPSLYPVIQWLTNYMVPVTFPHKFSHALQTLGPSNSTLYQKTISSITSGKMFLEEAVTSIAIDSTPRANTYCFGYTTSTSTSGHGCSWTTTREGKR